MMRLVASMSPIHTHHGGTPNQLAQPLTYLELRRDQLVRPCNSPSGQIRERALSAWLGYSELSKSEKLSGLGK